MSITEQDILEYKSYNTCKFDNQTDIYKDSPFKLYKDMSSKKKGAEFEKLVEEYAIKDGRKVEPPKSTDHDRWIQGFGKTEIKASLLWGTGTNYRWQQLRPYQDIDTYVFVAVSPVSIKFYTAPAAVVKAVVETQNDKGLWIHNQHGGKKVNSGTFFLDGFPEDYKWMEEWNYKIKTVLTT